MSRTVNLHRVLAASPDTVYRAFVEPDAVASWLPPFGYTCTVHAFDAKEGGMHRMSFRNFATGESHAFRGTYLTLRHAELIVYIDTFDDPGLPGEMKVTVTLRAVPVGTEMTITQENVPDAIPLEGCYVGWQQSLRKLGKLVEGSGG